MQNCTDKNFKHHTFIGMCSLFLFQSANTEFLLMKTHRVLNKSSKFENVTYRNNQVPFIALRLIRNQN